MKLILRDKCPMCQVSKSEYKALEEKLRVAVEAKEIYMPNADEYFKMVGMDAKLKHALQRTEELKANNADLLKSALELREALDWVVSLDKDKILELRPATINGMVSASEIIQDRLREALSKIDALSAQQTNKEQKGE